MSAQNSEQTERVTLAMWVRHPIMILVAGLVGASLLYLPNLTALVNEWLTSDEYGHGILLPFVAAYFVWQRRSDYLAEQPRPSWSSVVLILLSVVTTLIAIKTSSMSLMSYSYLILVGAVILACYGYRFVWLSAFPLLLLALAVPLPGSTIITLTSELQLLSSDFGVWIIRLFGISVFLEGNVIDLGDYQLFVAEACSGLRYLFSLVTLGAVIAYMIQAPFWMKALTVAVTIPISIFMNSLRIAITGVLVKEMGISAAEGFFHEFEGLVVFAGAFSLLIASVWLMSFLLPGRPSLARLFDMPAPAARPRAETGSFAPLIPVVVAVSLVIGHAATIPISNQALVVPDREPFALFPESIGGGATIRTGSFSDQIVEMLNADDYLVADFGADDGVAVNLHMAYYKTQDQGKGLHSPSICLPGGGWDIIHESTVGIPSTNTEQPALANRVVIRKGRTSNLVYFWIRQQDRTFASENRARIHRLMTSITRNRTDGALIRVIRPIVNNDLDAADKSVQAFIGHLDPLLPRFLPQ